MPINSTRPNIRQASLDKLEQREIWHKLVVKIILWKDSVSNSLSFRRAEKITDKEWLTYCRRVSQTNLTYGKQKVLQNLKELKATIKSNGGFESNPRTPQNP